jgi:hypothetical protein
MRAMVVESYFLSQSFIVKLSDRLGAITRRYPLIPARCDR